MRLREPARAAVHPPETDRCNQEVSTIPLGFVGWSPVGCCGRTGARASASPQYMPTTGPSATASDGGPRTVPWATCVPSVGCTTCRTPPYSLLYTCRTDPTATPPYTVWYRQILVNPYSFGRSRPKHPLILRDWSRHRQAVHLPYRLWTTDDLHQSVHY